MTSPIQPPGGGPPKVPGADAQPDPSKAKGTEGSREAFEATLDGADRGSDAQAAAPVDGVVADLRAGKIDAAAAVEKMVQEALSAPGVAQLDAAARAELEAHIRHTLEDDPNLAALVRDLDR
jgi:hypothetical protein